MLCHSIVEQAEPSIDARIKFIHLGETAENLKEDTGSSNRFLHRNSNLRSCQPNRFLVKKKNPNKRDVQGQKSVLNQWSGMNS